MRCFRSWLLRTDFFPLPLSWKGLFGYDHDRVRVLRGCWASARA